MEKLILKKRVYELKIGETFWFSGNWHIVTHKDEEYLYYKLPHNPNRRGNKNESIRANSRMLVAIQEENEKGAN